MEKRIIYAKDLAVGYDKKAVVKDIDIPGGTMTVEMPEEITAGGKEAAGDSHAH